MKKSWLMGIILSLALLTSCASGSKSNTGTADYGVVETTAAGYSQLSAGEAADAAAPIAKADSSAQNVSQVTNKKIIKDANLDIEAKDVSACYTKLLDYIITQGGYEFSQDLSNSTDYSSLSATIKIPPDKLDATLEFAKECGTIVNVSTSTSDITASYTDTEIRLENKKKNLEKYYEFYSKATTIEEIVAIQTQIDTITADIESYEGQIKLWNSLLDESSLRIYIQEASDPNKIPKDIEWNSISLGTMGKIIQNGFTAVINVIISFFQWLIIIIVSASPLLIITGIIIFIARKIDKKKKANLPQTIKTPENTNK